MTTSVPPVSTKGFQNAASYDQYRPSYPVDAVDSLLKHLQVHGLRGARIVDLAAGTGKFTGLLASRDEDYDIIAVEPHNDMRGELQKKLFKRVKVLEGEAESLESIGSQSADAVIASQVGFYEDTSQIKPSFYIVHLLTIDTTVVPLVCRWTILHCRSTALVPITTKS